MIVNDIYIPDKIAKYNLFVTEVWLYIVYHVYDIKCITNLERRYV